MISQEQEGSWSPDISLPEAGLAVLHVPLVVGHRHGSVVSVVAPEKYSF